MKSYLLLVFAVLSVLVSYGQSAKEIIDKANERMQGESNAAEMQMQIVRPSWTREISMKSWARGNDYSLVLITAPARDQGAAFLKR